MSPQARVACPKCSKPMTFGAASCRVCMSPTGGRKVGDDSIYADELGIRRRRIIKLGGAAKLRALSPEARNILLGKQNYGSVAVRKGGIIARGYKPRVAGVRSQAERVA